MKASKGSLASCLVHLNAGSNIRLAQQTLQIPEHANDRTLPSWIFDVYLPEKDSLSFFLSHPFNPNPKP